jgi:glycosyltransferase involved in cell wall biosynthesis
MPIRKLSQQFPDDAPEEVACAEEAAQASKRLSAVVLIPAYNEAGAVGLVVQSVCEETDYQVIVIDDASTDGTRDEAEAAGALVIPLVTNLGAWGATQTGIRYALRHGFDMAITLDADGQHDPKQLHLVAEPVMNGLADVSIGAYPERGSRLRQIAWVILRAVSGIRLEDLTSGYRAYGREALKELASWRATYIDFQDIGVLSLLLGRGLTVVDVPVTMANRTNGHSRIFRTWIMVGYYMCHTLLLGLTKRRIRRYQGIYSGPAVEKRVPRPQASVS